jgi:hypothetical protein
MRNLALLALTLTISTASWAESKLVLRHFVGAGCTYDIFVDREQAERGQIETGYVFPSKVFLEETGADGPSNTRPILGGEGLRFVANLKFVYPFDKIGGSRKECGQRTLSADAKVIRGFPRQVFMGSLSNIDIQLNQLLGVKLREPVSYRLFDADTTIIPHFLGEPLRRSTNLLVTDLQDVRAVQGIGRPGDTLLNVRLHYSYISPGQRLVTNGISDPIPVTAE